MFGANQGDDVCTPEEGITLIQKRIKEVKKDQML